MDLGFARAFTPSCDELRFALGHARSIPEAVFDARHEVVAAWQDRNGDTADCPYARRLGGARGTDIRSDYS